MEYGGSFLILFNLAKALGGITVWNKNILDVGEKVMVL